MTARPRTAALVLILAIASAACSNGSQPDARTQRQLSDGVEQVRTAVAAADRIGAREALRDLARTVSDLTDDGRLDQDRADEILAAAQDVADQLSLLPAPSPSPSPEPEPTSSPPAPSGHHGEGGGNDQGNGNGHAYGHDEDHGNGNGND